MPEALGTVNQEIQEHYNKLKELGLYFGYPECCVDFFSKAVIDLFNGQGKPPAQYLDGFDGSQLDGTGYIPCPDCFKKPHDELIEYIKAHRQCPTPFPED